MKKNLIGLFVIWTALNSCATDRRMTKGVLDQTQYEQLRAFITGRSNRVLKDTIIIKYDFNRETCWDMLDLQDDDYINRIISYRSEMIRKTEAIRTSVSILEFREAGDRINKLKRWSPDIIIDSSAQLRRSLFPKRKLCGSSVIILPNGQYLRINGDPHFDAVSISREEMGKILTP